MSPVSKIHRSAGSVSPARQGRSCSGRACMLIVLAVLVLLSSGSCLFRQKVGVLFIVHGGMDTFEPQYVWDSALQQFSYDPNHPVYSLIHNSSWWGAILQVETARKYFLKYQFEYERIGGTDPFMEITLQQMADMKRELQRQGLQNGFFFVFDWAGWMVGDNVKHYPYPRYMYNPFSGTGDACTYCGEDEADGPWENCDPERYNVDGPVERLLKKGVTKIIAIDLTVGGMRFSKTYDAVQLAKTVLDTWNTEQGTSVSLQWVNDPANLMERSFPTAPAGWTATEGAPAEDSRIPLDNSTKNPVVSDTELAALHVEGIEAAMNDTVADSQTGVLLINHAVNDYKETFDPKIDDTLVLNQNIKARLLAEHPDMDAGNIIGAFMGVKEENSENGLVERTREMRGEDLGYAWLYESNKEKPSGEWGYLYWDGLEYLKNRGVKHIVVAFTQIITHSVLDLVEVPNQIAKEIGAKNWLYWEAGDDAAYPGVGHPFADYWGNWVATDCGGQECCFAMGGCSDGRPYPPPRQTPSDAKRGDMDPSLAYDVCEYGHLGYDQSISAPDPTQPVQNQYTGTWAMWVPPNDDPRVGRLLAKYVLLAAKNQPGE